MSLPKEKAKIEDNSAPQTMPTVKELGLRPGSPCIYTNEAGITIWGTVMNVGEERVEIAVQVCNSACPIDELFPHSLHKVPLNDEGFKALPKLGE